MSATQPTPAIEMQAVTVSAMRDATHTVVEAVNWTVAPGEFWVLAGAQKSGKTDLLLLTAGLMPPMNGTYQLFGRDTRDFGEAELAERLRVGLVFAQGQLFHELTVAENIALPLRYHRNLEADEAERASRELLELLELTPLADAAPDSVSLDWRKRAALARALALRPQLLLCDNPLTGLGPRHRQWWLRFLDQLAQGHDLYAGLPITLVVTAEELGPWKNPARRYAVLRDRRFFPLGTWAELEAAGDPAAAELLAGPAAPTPPSN